MEQMAYRKNDDIHKRQIFVTCHHEDFTNKLLDYLMPPPGYKLKVVRFIVCKEGVPKIEYYDVEDEGVEDLEEKKVEFLKLMEARK